MWAEKNLEPITADFQIWEVDYRFQLQGNPTVASPKEQLYEQMTSNPALTERNIQKANAYLLDSRPEQKSVATYRTILYQACTYVFGFDFDFDFNSADWISDNLHVISRWYFRTIGKEFIFEFNYDWNKWTGFCQLLV